MSPLHGQCGRGPPEQGRISQQGRPQGLLRFLRTPLVSGATFGGGGERGLAGRPALSSSSSPSSSSGSELRGRFLGTITAWDSGEAQRCKPRQRGGGPTRLVDCFLVCMTLPFTATLSPHPLGSATLWSRERGGCAVDRACVRDCGSGNGSLIVRSKMRGLGCLPGEFLPAETDSRVQ